MTPFLATIRKELLEIGRDRAGLAMMLVMPMALVLIVSLVQDNVMRATGEAPIQVVFVDNDNSFLGRAIEENLSGAGLELVRETGGREFTAETARRAVIDGDFQFLIIIGPGTGNALRKASRQRAEESFVPAGKRAAPVPASVPGLTVRFDPAVQGTFRTAVLNSLRQVILGIEMREKGVALSLAFERKMRQVAGAMPFPSAETAGGSPLAGLRLEMDTRPVLDLAETEETGGRLRKRPTAAQQNVPAWALFGMFFIVVPVSGALIRERQTGTYRRLMTMPVSPVTLLGGKVVSYAVVCVTQFVLMLGIGAFVLPMLGTSGLVIGPEWPAIGVIALVASLAATGYGIMIGTLARSYEQASMVGAVSVVIAAALGGIMVPVYVMPRFMQDLSVVSPLAWGLTAFQDVFVREGTVRTAARELSYLSIFFLLTIMVAWLGMRKNRSGE